MSKLHDELKVRLNGWDWIVFVVALGALLLVLLETFMVLSAPTLAVFRWIDNAACGIFFIDVLVRWRRMGWSAEFWRWGWVDLLAAIPFDAAFRTLQILRVYRILRVLRILYKLQELTTGTTLNERLLALPGVALVMIVFSTALMVQAERHAPGATIKSGGDALWWALTTVTTVGYGDTYPVTTEGRIIAAGLMLVGIALFGSISAIVTSKLILPKETKDHEELRREVRALHGEIRELRDELRKK
ncbi:voltage-gated potassium channel [Verrucomicrobiota bacterium]|nr:voltage-gated potassium channel [Verrucomicrobiota bacterium]